MTEASLRLRQASGTTTELLGNEAVVWLDRDHTLHLFDGSGTIVWRCLETPATSSEIVVRVTTQVEGSQPNAASEILAFLDNLRRRSLIVAEE